jgi:WD40 repeat protein
VASGKPAAFSVLQDNGPGPVAFSPDGKRIAIASGTTARLWDSASGKPVGPPMQHPRAVHRLIFNHDGTKLITAADGPFLSLNQVRLVAVATGKPICPPLEHEGVTALAFNPDGKTILTASNAGTARLSDAATGKPIGEPMVHGGPVSACAFSPDGKLAATGIHQRVMLWNGHTAKSIGQALPLGDNERVITLAFSRDGRLLAAGTTKGTQVWEAAGGKPLKRFGDGGPVVAVAFNPDTTSLLTANSQGSARLWDLATGQPRTPPLRHQGLLSSAAFSPDGKTVLTFGQDNTARLWESAGGKQIGTAMRHRSITSAVFSPQGHLVLTLGLDGSARLWDAASARPLGPPLLVDGLGSVGAFSPDGKSFLTTLRLFDPIETRTQLWPVPLPIEGKSDRISLWVQILTGTELQADGSMRLLDVGEWQECRRRLQELGGPRLP